ncbi:MAG: fibronectin type III domain-containing protein [Flagellimonas sp.]
MRRRIYFIGFILLTGFCSCEDILEVPDISEQSVTLLAPSDGTVLEVNEVNLNWKEMEEAEGYNIQVATPTFENAAQLVIDSIVKIDSLGYVSTRLNKSLANGFYEWRVKAFNRGFETSYTSSSFQVMADESLDAIFLKAKKVPILTKEDEASGAYNLTINN